MMLSFLVRVYRANPLRPHCNSTRHTSLCKVATMMLPIACDKGNPIPPGKTWPNF